MLACLPIAILAVPSATRPSHGFCDEDRCDAWCSPSAAWAHCGWCSCTDCNFCKPPCPPPHIPPPPPPPPPLPPPPSLPPPSCVNKDDAEQSDDIGFADCKGWCSSLAEKMEVCHWCHCRGCSRCAPPPSPPPRRQHRRHSHPLLCRRHPSLVRRPCHCRLHRRHLGHRHRLLARSLNTGSGCASRHTCPTACRAACTPRSGLSRGSPV